MCGDMRQSVIFEVFLVVEDFFKGGRGKGGGSGDGVVAQVEVVGKASCMGNGSKRMIRRWERMQLGVDDVCNLVYWVCEANVRMMRFCYWGGK